MNRNEKTEKKSFRVFCSLTKRHLLVFFGNVPTVIFSLMVPLVILAVYILFLRNMEIATIKQSMIAEGIQFDETTEAGKAFLHHVYGIADCWMISGVLAVSCITISLNTNYIVVRDKESGISKDLISSPIDRKLIFLSYFTFNAVVTFAINLLVYFICLIYLAAYGAYMISVLDFFAIIGVLLLSTISASLITFFICSFINTESVMSPIVAIFSAAVGFLIGAYLPSNMVPNQIDYLTAFFPGTYSAGLLRNYFLHTPIEQLISSPELASHHDFVYELIRQFSLEIHFFQFDVPVNIMALVVFAFSGIFVVLNIFCANVNFVPGSKHKKMKKPAKEASQEKLTNHENQ